MLERAEGGLVRTVDYPVQGNLTPSEAHWVRVLSRGVPGTSLVPDFSCVADRPGPDAIRSYRVPQILARRLRRTCGADAVSLFTQLLAATKLALYHFRGSSRLAVGIPVPGSLSDALPVVTDIADDLSLSAYVKRVADAVTEVHFYQDVSSTRLAALLDEGGRGESPPRFAFMVALEELHGRQAAEAIAFDVMILFQGGGDGLTTTVRYRTDVFAASTIDGFVRRLLRMLYFLLRCPGAPIAAVPWMAPGERKRLLDVARVVTEGYPLDATIHGLFEKQVEKWGNRIAIEDGGERLGYREVNERANRVAHLLKQRGLRHGDFVAVLHERSARYLVFILAALKAGGAFVAIDPSYPSERVRFMLKDSQVRIVLTNADTVSRYRETLASLPTLDCVVLSDCQWTAEQDQSLNILDSDEIACRPDANLNVSAAGRDLCYMLYTSGSTGQPQGCSVLMA